MPNMPQSHSEQTQARRRKTVDQARASASERGYDRRWQRLRKLILHRDPICAICDRQASTDIDHIIPKAQGGEDTEENLQGLCHACHSKKTANEARPSIPTTIIAGPPGAGKSSYAAVRMRHGDLLVDLNTLYQAISGLDLYDKPQSLLQFAIAARDGIYYRLAHLWKYTVKPRHAWIIATLPKVGDRAELCAELGGSTVVLETSPNDCIRRLQADTERGASEARIEAQRVIIDEWWKDYTRGEGEKIIIS